jgi:hypothetical protein
MQMLRRIRNSKFVRAFALVATAMMAVMGSAFASSPAPVVVSMTGSGAGFTTTDLLTNTAAFMTQYATFIVLIAAIIFAKPLLNFIFFVLGKARGGAKS